MVQAIVAEVDVIALAVTDAITGAGAGAAVTKVKFADVEEVPEPLVDRTA